MVLRCSILQIESMHVHSRVIPALRLPCVRQSLHILVSAPPLLLFTCSFEFFLASLSALRFVAWLILSSSPFPTEVGALASPLNFGRLISSPFATSAATMTGRASMGSGTWTLRLTALSHQRFIIILERYCTDAQFHIGR